MEKHTNSIFLKLGLSKDEDVSKRVKACLLFLAEDDDQTTAARSDTESTRGNDVTSGASFTRSTAHVSAYPPRSDRLAEATAS